MRNAVSTVASRFAAALDTEDYATLATLLSPDCEYVARRGAFVGTAVEAVVVDDTGGLVIIFMGRRRIGGVTLGALMEIEGMVIENRGRLAVMNPAYTLLPHDA